MIKSFGNRVHYRLKLHPLMGFCISLSFDVPVLIVLSLYESQYRVVSGYREFDMGSDNYPFPKLQNLVMVAGHSIYTSSSCRKVDKEDSWFLESYQKTPGQASTFVTHIKEGIEMAVKDNVSLLLFSGGGTRNAAGPRSKAQSYCAVADSKGWFSEFEIHSNFVEYGYQVVSFDFKEDRFARLHRSAIGFPESRFFYAGTPATSNAKAAATKGKALVRAQFQKDPFRCRGSLYHKKLRRDPFHRSIPYPKGCPEIEALFRICGPAPYPGALPWA